MIDPNAATLDGTHVDSTPMSGVPAEIGPYRVLEKLGQGGMGLVLLGESSAPKRRAAIKLMLSSDFDADAIRRFRLEMEVLARLEHPGIARLYEVGTVVCSGVEQPWYAMEYVRGLPLDVYVKRQQLDVRSIFALTATIARALQFAHQKGVIHRDIKPANIMVNDAGQPKILDFGIARLNEGVEAGAKTRFGQIVGTLAYMSPEQLSSSSNADVRSDVYALGVVLFELLTGELPLKISTTSLLDAIKELAEGKRKKLADCRPGLRGEVALIVDTASSRELTQRYDSAASFAGDLESYLEHRPLQAKRPSLGYVFGKFVRRNPLLSGAVSIAVLTLLGATVFSMHAADQARLARDQAQQKALELSIVNGFVDRMMAEADPSSASSAGPTMRDALTGAEAAFDSLPNNAEVRARVALLLANAWNGSGEHEKALKYADIAVAEHKQIDELRLSAERARITAFNETERSNEALATIDKLLPLAEKTLGAHALPVVKLRAESMISLFYAGKPQEAANIGKQVLEEDSATLAAEGGYEFATLRRNYAVILRTLGQFAQAEQIHRDAWDAAVKAGTQWHPKNLYEIHSLAITLAQMGRKEEALAAFELAIAGRTKTLGDLHRTTIMSELSALGVLGELGRTEQGLALAESVLPRAAKTLGENSNFALAGRANYARLLIDAGRNDDAEKILYAVISAYAELAGDQRASLKARQTLAGLLRDQNRMREASKMYESLLVDAEKSFGEKHPLFAATLVAVADFNAQDQQRMLAKSRVVRALKLIEGRLNRPEAFNADADWLAAKKLSESIE